MAKAAQAGSKLPAPASGLKSTAKAVAQSALDRYLAWVEGRGDWALLHEPDAIAFPSRARTLISVMDLSVVLHPGWHPAHRVKKYERYFMRSLEQGSHFVAISEATKRDMIQHLKVKDDRISAIPLAPRGIFKKLPDVEIASVKYRWKLPDRYFLFVGNLEPRKNLPGLLRAYSRLPGSARAKHPLVLVGAWGWHSEDVREMLGRAPWKESVRHLGYLPDADLVAVTQGAMALVYPSFYEGFGLPPLEAMACGTPVISSRAGGLAEAIGDAAKVIDPEDEMDIFKAMKEVAESEELRKTLTEKGLAHAAQFSWDKTARATADIYRRLVVASAAK